jgi:hypothetical protein
MHIKNIGLAYGGFPSNDYQLEQELKSYLKEPTVLNTVKCFDVELVED